MPMNLLCYALASTRQNYQQGLDFERESVEDDVRDIGGHRLKNCLVAVGHDGKVVNEWHGDDDCW